MSDPENMATPEETREFMDNMKDPSNRGPETHPLCLSLERWINYVCKHKLYDELQVDVSFHNQEPKINHRDAALCIYWAHQWLTEAGFVIETHDESVRRHALPVKMRIWCGRESENKCHKKIIEFYGLTPLDAYLNAVEHCASP